MFIRVDDRLIHGQVVTAWIGQLNAKRIVVVDDKVAANAILSKALTLATPKQVKLTLTSLANVQETLLHSQETLFLVKSPEMAEKLIIQCSLEENISLCVGNVGKAEGRDKFTNSVYLDPENHEALKRVHSRAEVFFQMVPSDTRVMFSL